MDYAINPTFIVKTPTKPNHRHSRRGDKYDRDKTPSPTSVILPPDENLGEEPNSYYPQCTTPQHSYYQLPCSQKKIPTPSLVEKNPVYPPNTSNIIKNKKRNKNLSEYQKQRILLEYKHLKEYSPSGVYVIPSLHCTDVLYGVIFVRDGDYKNAIFKFKITLPRNYNCHMNCHPSIQFSSEVFHPYVDIHTGFLDLTIDFPIWDPTQHVLLSLVMYIKNIFFLQPSSIQKSQNGNEHAYILVKRDRIGYKMKVDQCIDDSQCHVKDDPNSTSSIDFSNHDEVKCQVLQSLMAQAFMLFSNDGVDDSERHVKDDPSATSPFNFSNHDEVECQVLRSLMAQKFTSLSNDDDKLAMDDILDMVSESARFAGHTNTSS